MSPRSTADRSARTLRQCLAAALAMLALPGAALAYCDEPVPAGGPRMGMADPARVSIEEMFGSTGQTEAMSQLASLAREALARSAEVRTSQYGELAAREDLKQAQAGRSPLFTVGGNGGLGQTRSAGQTGAVGIVGVANLGVTAPLYDGGRIDKITAYRSRLAEASAKGVGAQREAIVAEAVSAVLDRNRFRLQVQVYQQYAGKLSCLAGSLEKIVAQDRGRASELLQARQNQRQAEIYRDDAVSALRQADIHLRKVVGGNVAPWGGIGAPLLQVPELDSVLAQINTSPALAQLRLQADAADQLALLAEAQRKPQINWQAGGTTGRASQLTSTGWNAGVTLSYTIDDGGATAAAASAAAARARAAREQLDAVLNERVRQSSAYFEAARNAFQRAAQYAEALKDGDQVRNATFEQWSRLGRRSLFDLMSAEGTYYQMRIQYINAVHDGFSANTLLRSSGSGLLPWIAPEMSPQAR
ncbi:MAG: TolC family protein [Burkholderiales bacterium]